MGLLSFMRRVFCCRKPKLIVNIVGGGIVTNSILKKGTSQPEMSASDWVEDYNELNVVLYNDFKRKRRHVRFSGRDPIFDTVSRPKHHPNVYTKHHPNVYTVPSTLFRMALDPVEEEWRCIRNVAVMMEVLEQNWEERHYPV